MVFEFCSTSKVTFSGSGVAAVATSEKNREWFKKTMTIQTIGYDKINQLRHVKYFGDIEGMKAHMVKMADSLRPKFEAVHEVLEAEQSLADWRSVNGQIRRVVISFPSTHYRAVQRKWLLCVRMQV